MSWTERMANGLLAASVFSWSILGLAMAEQEQRGTAVRISIALLHLVVSGLLACRGPVRRQGPTSILLACLPALVLGGAALRGAPPPDRWPLAAEGLFVAGTGLAVAGLLWMGRSFSVLPALRGIVTGGPFRWVRHPAYAGELLMIAACVSAAWSWQGALLLAAAVLALVARIAVEERLLRTTASYRRYAQRVPWRLLPYVW